MHCTVVFINFTKNFWIRRSSRNGPQTVNIEFKVLCNLLQTLIGEKGGEDVLVYLPLTIAGSCFLKKSYIDAYNTKERIFIMNAIRFQLSRDAFFLESKNLRTRILETMYSVLFDFFLLLTHIYAILLLIRTIIRIFLESIEIYIMKLL